MATEGTTYTLNFRPTHTLLDVKLSLCNLTDIPVSRQKWIGWPDRVSDDLSLAQIGIPRHHKLYLSALPRPQSATAERDVSKYPNFNSLATKPIFPLHFPIFHLLFHYLIVYIHRMRTLLKIQIVVADTFALNNNH